jgi:hypothetical protein
MSEYKKRGDIFYFLNWFWVRKCRFEDERDYNLDFKLRSRSITTSSASGTSIQKFVSGFKLPFSTVRPPAHPPTSTSWSCLPYKLGPLPEKPWSRPLFPCCRELTSKYFVRDRAIKLAAAAWYARNWRKHASIRERRKEPPPPPGNLLFLPRAWAALPRQGSSIGHFRDAEKKYRGRRLRTGQFIRRVVL